MAKQERVDPREQELFDTMVMDSMDYIHGVGFDQIVEVLGNSTDTTQSIATIAYKAVRGVADKNQASARIEMDMDMMMGLTAETIDMIGEVAQAGGQLPVGTNTQQMKEDAMVKVAVLHGEQLETAGITDEQKTAAQTDLRDYTVYGTQKAFDYVNKRAEAEGLNPNDMKRQGNEMLTGKRKPLQSAVKKGLMSQQGPPNMPDPLPTGEGIVPSGMPQAAPEAPLMTPPVMPDPLPTGEGLVPSGLPPAQDPNAAILPPGNGRR